MLKLRRLGIVTIGLLLAGITVAEAQPFLKGQMKDVNFEARLNGTAIGIPVPGFPNPPEIQINGGFTFDHSPHELDLASATFHHFVNIGNPLLFRSHDGTFVLRAADGSTLIGAFLGAIRPPTSKDPVGRGQSYWLITNGTGRFAGALGAGDFTSELGIGAGGSETADLKWKGTVTIPDPKR